MKKFEDVLFLEKMGCNFWKDEPAKNVSDVGNYRVRTHGEVINGKDGKTYFLEFTLWSNRYKMRYTNKRTGKALKNPVKEIINPFALNIDTEYTDNNGCWRNCKLEEKISAYNYSYTCEDILKAVNEISKEQYKKIIFADEKAIEAIPSILSIAGYREKNILENLKEVKLSQYDKNYIVYKYIDNNDNTFEYELKSKRITG